MVTTLTSTDTVNMKKLKNEQLHEPVIAPREVYKDSIAEVSVEVSKKMIKKNTNVGSANEVPPLTYRDNAIPREEIVPDTLDGLPKEMKELKIRDDKSSNADNKEIDVPVVDGIVTEVGQVIAMTVGGKNGQLKQTVSYKAERVVGTGSFGTVFQAKCLETGETVAIKKVLQDKRYKNRELQMMRLMEHPNIVSLKHCFFFNH